MIENPFLHTECGQLARADLNGLNYGADEQRIVCEGCGKRVVRRWTGVIWTPWETRDGS